ncbi:polyamine-modulated factor 1-binding protein, putative [Entamoeba histolytica HM-3:IMSS]|uniref:Polyamine-modulated factor 1-binding protein, putative n=1 Tax=Entamoeba histolytica HM-3:IMSS TaxID=885315 RepID=M7W3Y6_ENTHI|nr:polyamine-modulated factor 1-binding protein, putative [Entamoeba histolytica HM-3:IMSS]
MQEAEEILFGSLHNCGVVIPKGIDTLKGIISESGVFYNLTTQILKIIDQQKYGIFTDSIPKQTSEKVRVCAKQASIIKEMGFNEPIGYHQILYPKTTDVTNILNFLMKYIPDDLSTNKSIRNSISKTLYDIVHNMNDEKKRRIPPQTPIRQKDINQRKRVNSILQKILQKKVEEQNDVIAEMKSNAKTQVRKEIIKKEENEEEEKKEEDVMVAVELKESKNEKKIRLESELDEIVKERQQVEDILQKIKTRIEKVEDYINEGKNELKEMIKEKEELMKKQKTLERQKIIREKVKDIDANDKDEYIEKLEELKQSEMNKLEGLKQKWTLYEDEMKKEVQENEKKNNVIIEETKQKAKEVKQIRQKGKAIILEIQSLDEDIKEKEQVNARLDKRMQRQIYIDRTISMTKFLKKQDKDLEKIFNDTNIIKSDLTQLKIKVSENYINLIRLIRENTKYKEETKHSLITQITKMNDLFSSLVSLETQRGELNSTTLLSQEKYEKTQSRVEELGYVDVKKDFDELHKLNLEMINKINEFNQKQEA